MKKKYFKIFMLFRKLVYKRFSDNKTLTGFINDNQPVVLKGKGNIKIGKNVNIGVLNSPMFYNTYAYIEARNKNASIIFGDNIHINNNFRAIAEKRIIIGDNTLIGINCEIIDSNFHNLSIKKRLDTDPNPSEITIKKGVFIGNNVTILKGVTIGENSIIGNRAVVTKSFPENVIIAGNPARVINRI